MVFIESGAPVFPTVPGGHRRSLSATILVSGRSRPFLIPMKNDFSC